MLSPAILGMTLSLFSALPARIKAKGNSSRRGKRKIVVVDNDNRIMRKTVTDNNEEDEYDGRAIGNI